MTVLAQPRHHLQAIEAGQHHVEHDEVRTVLERRVDGRRPVGGGDREEALPAQVARDDLRDRRLVVDHEDRLGERHAAIVRRVARRPARVSRRFRAASGSLVVCPRGQSRSDLHPCRRLGETSLGDGGRSEERPADRGIRDGRRARCADRRRPHPRAPDGYDGWLLHIQNDLFDLGADLAVPEEIAPGSHLAARAHAPPDLARAGALARAALRRGQRRPRAAALVRARPEARPPRPSCTSRARSRGEPSA